MGMYFGATICTGVFVYEEGGELNSAFVNTKIEEEEEQGQDFYMVEFLEDIFQDTEYELVLGGADQDSQTTIIAIKDTVIETEWSPINITGADLNITIDMEEELSNIKSILKNKGLNYKESGVFLVPYFYT